MIKDKIKLKDTFTNQTQKELLDLTKKIREYEDFMSHIEDIKKKFFWSHVMSEKQLLEYIAADDQKNYIYKAHLDLPYEVNGKNWKSVSNLDETFVYLTNGKWKYCVPIDEQTHNGRYLIVNNKHTKYLKCLDNVGYSEGTIVEEKFTYKFDEKDFNILYVTQNIIKIIYDNWGISTTKEVWERIYEFDVVKNKMTNSHEYRVSKVKIPFENSLIL